MVITSDRPPKEMTLLDDRLRTRFEGGMMAHIAPPELETRIAIAKRKASLIGLDQLFRGQDKARSFELAVLTGMRVGELVNLNRSDVNFELRECIVFGKGGKERKVYFDAKAKLHLQEYLNGRVDDDPALFVTLDKPFERLKISGVEIRVRSLGKSVGLTKIHPHKFRRSMATRAIDKGMPIEQVQKILGHSQIDTTMQYAIVNQGNVKISHQKYIS